MPISRTLFCTNLDHLILSSDSSFVFRVGITHLCIPFQIKYSNGVPILCLGRKCFRDMIWFLVTTSLVIALLLWQFLTRLSQGCAR